MDRKITEIKAFWGTTGAVVFVLTNTGEVWKWSDDGWVQMPELPLTD